MSLSISKIEKYNIYVTQLFNLILTLNPEEQRYLLKNIEKLLLDEKRRSARKICKIPVTYFYNKQTYNDFIINISRNGCFIETQKPHLVGKNILLDIQLDRDDKPVRFKGEVANANRFGVGIEFEEISSNLLGKLGKFLYKII